MTRFRDLSLVWKLLLPFLALMLLLGVIGGFVVVRDLTARAETTLDRELSLRLLQARSLVRDQELYLIESANFASNLEGITEEVRAVRPNGVARLLESVLALKTDLRVLVVTDKGGSGLAEFLKPSTAEQPQMTKGGSWASNVLVSEVLKDGSTGNKSSGLLEVGGTAVLAMAAPICSEVESCKPIGAVVVGIGMEGLAEKLSREESRVKAGAAIYDLNHRQLITSGLAAPPVAPDDASGTGLTRHTGKAGSQEIATLYAPLELQGARAGTLAVSIPTAPAFASARGAAIRLGLALFAGMLGIGFISALLSRRILSQSRSLLEANRALAQGDLSARAAVFAHDELGEVAQGVNEMAERLQESVSTLESRVAERTEEVSQLLSERTEFFTSISHELRTPLAVILHKADLLLDPAVEKSDRWTRETGDALRESGEQVLAFVNDILGLAKAEAGGIPVDMAVVRLPEVVKGLRGTIEALSGSSGVKIKSLIPNNTPKVQADRERLQQILMNLLHNAVKYTPSPGRIDLSAEAHNGFVEVSVSDTGIGIPAEAGQRIFEPFYTVKRSTPQFAAGAVGLGLALTKKLVEAQGGQIRYASNPDRGTTFTFSLLSAEAVES